MYNHSVVGRIEVPTVVDFDIHLRAHQERSVVVVAWVAGLD